MFTRINICIKARRFRVINNPLIYKKIDVVKTCQSNIIPLDPSRHDGCLETWNTPGAPSNPSITLHLGDIVSANWSKNSWYVEEIKENRQRLVGRGEGKAAGGRCLCTDLSGDWYLRRHWYENVGKYLFGKNQQLNLFWHMAATWNSHFIAINIRELGPGLCNCYRSS